MKLFNLIPLREVEEDKTSPELIANAYFRQFQTSHGCKPLFKFIGTKKEEHAFVADITDFGMFDLIVKDAKIYAKITEKYAVFGMVYTMTGLTRLEATICRMNQKDGKIEVVMFDSKDKKNFDAKTTNFLKLIDDEK
jgi:hypothetical protein